MGSIGKINFEQREESGETALLESGTREGVRRGLGVQLCGVNGVLLRVMDDAGMQNADPLRIRLVQDKAKNNGTILIAFIIENITTIRSGACMRFVASASQA
jgi:hypothetical protein